MTLLGGGCYHTFPREAMQTLSIEFKEEIIWITLNRPDEFNAINEPMMTEIAKVLDNIRNDRSVRAIILTGKGKAFCYGLDFHEIEDLTPEEKRIRIPVLMKKYQSIIYTFAMLDRPVIACLNGFATGAGLDLALSCDFRIAAQNVKLSSAYVKLALVPDGGGTFFLPRMIGYGRAMDMVTRGTIVTAEEGLGMGLVTKVVPADRLMEEAAAFAKELARGPTRTIAVAKGALFKNSSCDLEKALTNEGQIQMICFASNDHTEAIAAQKEKRKPRFKGY